MPQSQVDNGSGMLNTVALDGVAFHYFLAAHRHFLDNNPQLVVHDDGPPPCRFYWRRIAGNDLLHYFYYASVRDRGMRCRQYTPPSNATTPESNKSGPI